MIPHGVARLGMNEGAAGLSVDVGLILEEEPPLCVSSGFSR